MSKNSKYTFKAIEDKEGFKLISTVIHFCHCK